MSHELTAEQKLAEAIHSATCRSNHTDGCAWEYQKWETFKESEHGRYDTRVMCLNKARAAIKAADGNADVALKIIRAII